MIYMFLSFGNLHCVQFYAGEICDAKKLSVLQRVHFKRFFERLPYEYDNNFAGF